MNNWIDEKTIQATLDLLPNFAPIIILIITIIGVLLGVSKKAVYFSNYNDLGLSAAVFAAPATIFLVTAQFGIAPDLVLIVVVILFFGLLLTVLFRTWKANNKSIIKTFIIGISKLVMSFLYVFYLYQAFTGDKAKTRRTSWFTLAIFTPLLIALVQDKTGSFKLNSRGRPVY